MNREEATNALIESGMELRRDDIELGKKLEREFIIKLLERKLAKLIQEMRKCDSDDAQRIVVGQVSAFQKVIALIKGEQK